MEMDGALEIKQVGVVNEPIIIRGGRKMSLWSCDWLKD